MLFNLYVNNIPTSSCHVKLVYYMDGMALIAISHSPSLLGNLLEAYLGRLEHWLLDWRSAISISKSTAVVFVQPVRCLKKPRQVQFLGVSMRSVQTNSFSWGEP
jgi:hypothetical protein